MTQPRWKSAVSDFRIHQSQLPFLRQLDEASIPAVLSDGVGQPWPLQDPSPRILLPARRESTAEPAKHSSLPNFPLGEACYFLARIRANKGPKTPHTLEAFIDPESCLPLGPSLSGLSAPTFGHRMRLE